MRISSAAPRTRCAPAAVLNSGTTTTRERVPRNRSRSTGRSGRKEGLRPSQIASLPVDSLHDIRATVYTNPDAQGCGLIASFADKATESLFHGETGKVIRRIPSGVRSTAVRKLDLLNAAHELQDLRIPPGNRLEALKGDLRGKHSIRINDQWRIVFRWRDGDAYDVEIDDYH